MTSLRYRSWFMILLAAAACGRAAETPGATAQAADPGVDPVADRAAVEAAVKTHWAAINAGDSETIERQHTANMTMWATEVEPRFVFPSAEAGPFLEIIRGSRPRFAIEDLRVQMLGDVAVATFYLGGGVTRADGTVDDRRRRVTEVWMRQADGSWTEAHHHDSVFSPS